MRITDPRHDKKRIEDIKGGPLEESRLLWVKGDPGKGKTMLLCGIIDELEKSVAKTDLLSYFFCQAMDSRINNATAPSLFSYIQKKYDHAGEALFGDANAWVALSEIFSSVLKDPNLNSIYLIVDALDECIVGLPELLGFIARMSSISPRVKWIISSRNWPVIEKELDAVMQKARLCLEINQKSISNAIATYIQFKVDWLAKRNKYTTSVRDAVHRYLSLNAEGTFLWVALVCQEMSNTPRWKAQQKGSEDVDLCKRVLAITLTVYRPITLDELESFVDMSNGVNSEYEALSEIIGLSKDFLLAKAFIEIFPSRKEETHHEIFSRSLKAISRTLRRDIYSLGALDCPITLVKQLDPDPLVALRYSNIYWVDHLCDWNSNSINQGINSQDKGNIKNFIRKK
ncbi:uncharacterized protein BDR25DRAFT_329318 [Lindgomyces ingoldianus]|uniref:Uncharacterized protein n=1 Tax=Lindgomyces ingoldianus TaxID=673940 RepID=A0ACB6QB66_9PLEO|nr:uncharacterized protein BDR25DRAFT_329318 [Lindgomyces ingoldianus]KAF2464141.1 hypothetical protein BDR25DRAFT_329318 [Lindgomyces ingoldianus]